MVNLSGIKRDNSKALEIFMRIYFTNIRKWYDIICIFMAKYSNENKYVRASRIFSFPFFFFPFFFLKRNKYFVTIEAVKMGIRVFNILRLIFIQHLKYKNTRRKTSVCALKDIKFCYSDDGTFKHPLLDLLLKKWNKKKEVKKKKEKEKN